MSEHFSTLFTITGSDWTQHVLGILDGSSRLCVALIIVLVYARALELEQSTRPLAGELLKLGELIPGASQGRTLP